MVVKLVRQLPLHPPQSIRRHTVRSCISFLPSYRKHREPFWISCVRVAGDAFLIRSLVLLHLAFATTPVLAQNAAGAAAPVESAPPPAAEESDTPIISDEEFDAAIPSLDGKPLESVEEWQREQDARDEAGASEDVRQQTQQTAEESANPALCDGDAVEILSDPPVVDPLLD